MAARKVPSWDEYFISLARLAATKSKDPSTQVGCVIVGEGRAVLSTGYNGFPRGVDDTIMARYERPVKDSYTAHAERNAVFNAARRGIKLEGSTLYLSCNGTPCDGCAQAIIQAGIVMVVSIDPDAPFEGKGNWAERIRIGREMLVEAGVRIRKMVI